MSFKDSEYILVQGWMVNQLKLKGNDLLIYALIHRYSQDGVHKFYGSLQYLADWTNSTIAGVQNNLKSLLDKNLIFKNKLGDSQSSRCEYWVNIDMQQSCNDMQQSCKPLQLSFNDMQKSCNNNILNNNINNILNNKSNLFPFKNGNNKEPDILEKNIFYEKNKKSRSYKVLNTWLTLYVDNIEIRNALSNWLSIMYSNKKISNLDGLKNKVDYLYENVYNDEDRLMVIKDATDKCWFTFQYSVEKLYKNSNKYNIQGTIPKELIRDESSLDLSNEVF